MSFASMPEELVDLVVQNFTYPLELFHRTVEHTYDRHSTWRFTYAMDPKYKLPSSPGLLSLSQVNRRLRRLCLPLLFTYVHVLCFDDAEKVMQGSAKSLFARYTKTLILGNPPHDPDYYHCQISERLLLELIDFLENLSCVDFRCLMHESLFNTVNQHRSVSTIYVDSQRNLPKSFVDLSKVIIRCLELQHPDDCSSRVVEGLAHQTISHLYLQDRNLFEEGLGIPTFSGLRELTVIHHMDSSLSWIPKFASAHPRLKTMNFMPDFANGPIELTFFPPFSKFLEDLEQQDLFGSGGRGEFYCRGGLYCFFQVTLSRFNNANNANSFVQLWCVTGLSILVRVDCIEVFTLIGSSFPEIDTLAIYSHFSSRCHIDELINALKCLPLQELDLGNLFRHIPVGAYTPWKSILQSSQHEKLVSSVVVEAEKFWYTSLIAQHIPSLCVVWLADYGTAYRRFIVQNIPGGGREVIGGWELSRDHQILLSLASKG